MLQDTFVTMWIRRSSITLVGQSTLPWLLTTSRYLSLNHARAAKRLRSDSIEVATELPSSAHGPAGVAQPLELRTELRAIRWSRRRLAYRGLCCERRGVLLRTRPHSPMTIRPEAIESPPTVQVTVLMTAMTRPESGSELEARQRVHSLSEAW
ncbi:MAG: RNA polymerase sigma factor [Microcella pacifica]